MPRRAWTAATLAVALAWCGCGGPGRGPAAPPHSPRRIISLAPSVTETLFALDLGDRVVGVTRYCDFPEAALAKAKVGGFLDPSYEAIVALEPDLVIVQQDSRDAESRLHQLRIATLRVDQHDVNGILASIRTIAAACGEPARGEALGAALFSRLAGIALRTKDRPRPRALVVVGREPGVAVHNVWVAGRGVFYDEVLELAGGTNAYAGGGGAFPEVSREGLATLDPEVILDVLPEVGRRRLDPAEVQRDWRGLGELRAVRDGRVVVLEQAFMERPGPRVVAMVETVAKALHPEVAWTP